MLWDVFDWVTNPWTYIERFLTTSFWHRLHHWWKNSFFIVIRRSSAIWTKSGLTRIYRIIPIHIGIGKNWCNHIITIRKGKLKACTIKDDKRVSGMVGSIRDAKTNLFWKFQWHFQPPPGLLLFIVIISGGMVGTKIHPESVVCGIQWILGVGHLKNLHKFCRMTDNFHICYDVWNDAAPHCKQESNWLLTTF